MNRLIFGFEIGHVFDLSSEKVRVHYMIVTGEITLFTYESRVTFSYADLIQSQEYRPRTHPRFLLRNEFVR